jgi:hypothetical protein
VRNRDDRKWLLRLIGWCMKTVLTSTENCSSSRQNNASAILIRSNRVEAGNNFTVNKGKVPISCLRSIISLFKSQDMFNITLKSNEIVVSADVRVSAFARFTEMPLLHTSCASFHVTFHFLHGIIHFLLQMAEYCTQGCRKHELQLAVIILVGI